MASNTLNGVDPTQNATLAEIESKTGRNNFYRMMAHRPEAMQAFQGLYKSIMGPGVLDRRLKEMIYLAVSCVNECDYCTAHHLKGARAAGLTESEIYEIQAENNQHFTPKEQAALHYTRELTRTADVEGVHRFAVEELFSTDQIVEMTMTVCLANFTNRFNNGLETPVEAMASSAAPIPRSVG
ncbi:MAG TPA: carboxymuconolactone decarboxylase family protein [Bryobacteraceae bacterium]|jgi:uncharacterized peroxidase-related enzyme|nr:carboxymuconolactone decarboxylase family protein [Bryobacteraceae bacterium]